MQGFWIGFTRVLVWVFMPWVLVIGAAYLIYLVIH